MKLAVTSAATVTATGPPQLSDVTTAETFAAGIALAQPTVIGAGQVIVGGVLSSTVMIWSQVVVFPHASVAVYLLVMVKLLAHVKFVVISAATVTTTLAPPQLSEALTEAILGAGMALAQDTVTLAGQRMEGPVLSSTTMICAQDAVFPQRSVATKTRVTVKLLRQVKLDITSGRMVIETAP